MSTFLFGLMANAYGHFAIYYSSDSPEEFYRVHQMFRIGLDRFLQPLYLRALTEWYMDADKIPLAGLFATMSFATVMMLALLYLSVVGGRGRAALVCTAVGEHAAVGAGRVLCHL